MSQDKSPTEAPDRKLLDFAWNRHKVYSKNASRYRARFAFLRNLLLVLSVVVVALSVIDASLTKLQLTKIDSINHLQKPFLSGIHILQPTLQHCLIILPITISALLAFAVKFDRGNNWLLLRGSAEVLKSEIYCYRTRIREYKENRNEILAHKTKLVSERLKGSAVHQAALNPDEEEPPSHYKLGWVIKIITLSIRLIGKLFLQLWNQLFGLEKLSEKILFQTMSFQISVPKII
ncbi:DUF4231 domain-containing protein [Leptothoe sp. ISB3NOV94-8A]